MRKTCLAVTPVVVIKITRVIWCAAAHRLIDGGLELATVTVLRDRPAQCDDQPHCAIHCERNWGPRLNPQYDAVVVMGHCDVRVGLCWCAHSFSFPRGVVFIVGCSPIWLGTRLAEFRSHADNTRFAGLG